MMSSELKQVIFVAIVLWVAAIIIGVSVGSMSICLIALFVSLLAIWMWRKEKALGESDKDK
jgi:uncharacterized membrane protein